MRLYAFCAGISRLKFLREFHESVFRFSFFGEGREYSEKYSARAELNFAEYRGCTFVFIRGELLFSSFYFYFNTESQLKSFLIRKIR